MAYARRHSSTRIIFAALMLWGTLAALTGVIRQFWLLALDRFLLGVAESIIFPAMLVLITHWFTRAERSRANTLLMLGNPITVLWMSVITGYLIQLLLAGRRPSSLKACPRLLWAFLWLLLMRDKPSDAPWMSADSSAAIRATTRQEQLALPRIGSLREAFARRDVLLLSVVYFCWSVGVYGFVLWLPDNHSRQRRHHWHWKTGLLAAVPYLLAVILMLLAGTFLRSIAAPQGSDVAIPYHRGRGALRIVFSSQGRSFWMAYVALILAGGAMYAPYGSFFAFISEIIPKNVLDEVLALMNSSGALGGFAGAWLVGLLQARTGTLGGISPDVRITNRLGPAHALLSFKRLCRGCARYRVRLAFATNSDLYRTVRCRWKGARCLWRVSARDPEQGSIFSSRKAPA